MRPINGDEARADLESMIDLEKRYGSGNKNYISGLNDAVELIKSLPTIEKKKPNEGHWILFGLCEKGTECECSECHHDFTCEAGNPIVDDNWFYCSYCGAKMDEPIEDKIDEAEE